MPIGFKFPFAKASGSVGYFATSDDELDAVAQNMKSLLLTNWGERPMHFNFGANLREFLFDPERNDDLRARMADRIQTQLATWMPFLVVDLLEISFQDDNLELPDHGVGISIGYRLSARPELSSRINMVVAGREGS